MPNTRKHSANRAREKMSWGAVNNILHTRLSVHAHTSNLDKTCCHENSWTHVKPLWHPTNWKHLSGNLWGSSRFGTCPTFHTKYENLFLLSTPPHLWKSRCSTSPCHTKATHPSTHGSSEMHQKRSTHIIKNEHPSHFCLLSQNVIIGDGLYRMLPLQADEPSIVNSQCIFMGPFVNILFSWFSVISF